MAGFVTSRKTQLIALFASVCMLLNFVPYSCNGCTKYKCRVNRTANVTMRFFSGQVLETTILNRTDGEVLVDLYDKREGGCVKECVDLPPCITVLINVTGESCTLYGGDDIYAQPRGIVTHDRYQGYKLISLGNAVCRSQPCQYGGKCVPDYESGEYTCECLPGHGGETCEGREEPVFHVSFDDYNTDADPRATLPELKFVLKNGKVMKWSGWRGEVLLVRDQNQPLTVQFSPHFENVKTSENKLLWFTNFFLTKTNLTVTMWVKVDHRTLEDNFRIILGARTWSVAYNGRTRMVRWNVGVNGDATGANFYVLCHVTNIHNWTYFAFAGHGETETLKMYVDGKKCGAKTNPSGPLTADDYKDFELDFFSSQSEGYSFLDEFKIFQTFPSDDVIRESFFQEHGWMWVS